MAILIYLHIVCGWFYATSTKESGCNKQGGLQNLKYLLFALTENVCQLLYLVGDIKHPFKILIVLI